MARIVYSGSFGNKVAAAINALHQANGQLSRALREANAMSANGATPAGIEQVPEFGNIATGQGAQFYADLVALQGAVAAAVALQAATDLDQGGV